MKKGQKLYFEDLRGRITTYTVTNITDTEVEVTSDEFPHLKETFTIEQAVILAMRCSTIESAHECAEERRSRIKARAIA